MKKKETYEEFIEKFKPKKTTDDCYTPPAVYDAVKKWVGENLIDLDSVNIVRPFYPGGDYENYEYPANSLVLDNPPFSIFAKIVDFYVEHDIKFFLFAPALTLFIKPRPGVTFIVCGESVIYENGANVSTSFITNLCPEWLVWCAGDLSMAIKKANKMRERKSVAKLSWPMEFFTAAIIQRIPQAGISIRFRPKDLHRRNRLGHQHRESYGGGFLLSERAAAERAAERAAAERAAERIQLTEEEWKIVRSLGGDQNKNRKKSSHRSENNC